MMKFIIGVIYCFYLKKQNLFYNKLSLFQNCYLVKTFGFLTNTLAQNDSPRISVNEFLSALHKNHIKRFVLVYI